MPRANVSRATSSRPYDRRSSTASPASPTGEYLNQDQEGVPSDVPGLPTYNEYKRIESGYLYSLSPRKRDKALITQAMFDKIWDVLHQPEACTIETPQFRFWVRKMFSLSRPVPGGQEDRGQEQGGSSAPTYPVPDSDTDTNVDLAFERSLGIGRDESTAEADALTYASVVLHENRPVAIMEQLYALFCYCHVRAGHGGRDKTCAVIREHYSWVPKELTAQFVKACPTCVLKRSGHGHGMSAMGMGVGVGVGLDVVGVFTGGRMVGRGRKRGGGEMPVPMGSAGFSVGWPTTGGPLDPTNSELCGVRERLGAREAVGTSSPGASPTRSSKKDPVPLENCRQNGWRTSPSHPRSPLGHPLAVVDSSDREGPRDNPTKTDLPSLASALSNESLDANVNLTSLAPGDHEAGDSERLLPPALRPLRLLGPAAPEADSHAGGPASYPFQIDPVLLSFNYPGLDLPCESGPGFGGSAATTTYSEGASELHEHRPHIGLRGPLNSVESPGTILDRMWSLPALVPSRDSDSPDSSFERSSYPPALPFSLSTEFVERSRCRSRGPFDMFKYHSGCSVDEVGQELVDGPPPPSLSIMTSV